jgi:hypothetical protein
LYHPAFATRTRWRQHLHLVQIPYDPSFPTQKAGAHRWPAMRALVSTPKDGDGCEKLLEVLVQPIRLAPAEHRVMELPQRLRVIDLE